ncbi:MAG TPA: hypothetical protein VFJ16_29525 [Longimicrobium sp.]|nr:hypothetical protein [Longimicrobium sp.]
MGNGRTQSPPAGSPDVLGQPSRRPGPPPEQHAIRALLADILSRRMGGCPHAADGPALVIGIDLGIEAKNGETPGEAPGRPRGAHAEENAAGHDRAPAFSFGGLREALEAMASAPAGGPEPGEDGGAPAAEQVEEREEFEEFYHRQTLVIEDDSRGKMVTAAVVGFGLGAAAMFLARHLQPAMPGEPRGIH